MALQPFRNEQLNYFKFASIALNEFPKALRQTFKSMWDNNLRHRPGHQLWDDSAAVRNLFLTFEGGPGKTKVPTNLSYEEWDCTNLFQATIYANSFSMPDSRGHLKTLGELHVKPRKLAPGVFHTSVVSPGGDNAETFALAIDQLRLLRNALCHSHSSEIEKTKFDHYVQLAKDAFKALGIKTDHVNVIGCLTESEFPTDEVRKLEERLKEEYRACASFLQQQNQQQQQNLEGMALVIEGMDSAIREIKIRVEIIPTKDDVAQIMEQKMKDLKLSPTQERPGNIDNNNYNIIIH